jgi:hypothetical protein
MDLSDQKIALFLFFILSLRAASTFSSWKNVMQIVSPYLESYV